MSDPNINPNTGGPIGLPTAIQWTTNFRNANPGAIKGHFFGSVVLHNILNQFDCVGIRMYNAVDDLGNTQMIIVGVNSNAEDMTDGIVADFSAPCPTHCDINSVLAF